MMTFPATMTAPTGTSSRSAAFCASVSAIRIKYSSSPGFTVSAFWFRMNDHTYILEFVLEPLLNAVTLPVDDLDGFVGRDLEVELDKSLMTGFTCAQTVIGCIHLFKDGFHSF